MDFTTPISRFMTRKLIAVSPGDRMSYIKEIFDKHRIHHIPVVKYTTLVGIISRTDFNNFLKGRGEMPDGNEANACFVINEVKVEEIMTKGIATLESTDRVNVALQVFSENLFHAIPVVDDGELVGIITTFDIIRVLLEEDNARIKQN